MRAAARTLLFEPNATGAIQTSADALTPALGWGLALVAAAVALAVLTGKRRLALLGGPGLVVAVFVLVAPRANGARSYGGCRRAWWQCS